MAESGLDARLVAGMATAIGRLPLRDPNAAAALVLRCLPELPAAPQLPARTPLEGVIAQWAGVIPGVAVQNDGSIELRAPLDVDASLHPQFCPETHAGLLSFLDIARRQPMPPRRVKLQVVGPLTLGVALEDAGAPADIAFPLAVRVTSAWANALEDLVATELPGASLVLFYDEPGLVRWHGDDGPVEREIAIDLLSSALATTSAMSGVHVCGAGDLRIALDAGPSIVHFDVDAFDITNAIAMARFLEGDGWVAWGAIPTHRPVGEHAQPLWKTLVELWCELTRRGCDPLRLRRQALVAPACGLAGHGESQAERALLLAREIGNRVHDHAAATKLAIGA
jgi:hypothetical protein